MKQIYQSFKKNSLDVYDVPIPKLRDGMALIKNVASVISVGTEGMVTSFGDKNLIQKALSRPDLVKQVLDKVKTDGLVQTFNLAKSNLEQPLALGYSCAGEVLEVSNDITDITVGDRVACAGGGYAVHAEQIVVPRNLLAKIPDNVKFDHAAFTTIGSIAMQGVRLANVQVGESVAVLGLGLIGLITIQILKAAGCKVVAYDPKNSQCSIASELGLINTTSSTESFIQMCKGISYGYGIDKVIITASTKSDKPVETAGIISRDKGKVVTVGAVGLSIPRKVYYEKELELIVSKSYGPGRYDYQYEEVGNDYPIGYVRWTENRNMMAFLDLLDDEKIQLDRIITHRYEIKDAKNAYELLNNNSDENPIGILIDYPKKQAKEKKINFDIKIHHTDNKNTIPKIGIIGAGGFASNILIPIMNKSKVQKVGICNNSPHSSHHKANIFGFEYCTTDTDQIFHDENINTIIISTRHDSHAELVLKALELNKNVFVEKPLAIHLEELNSIESAIINNQSKSEASNTSTPILMVGFNRRFSPLSIKMKSLIERQSSPVSIIITVNVGNIPRDHWTQDPLIGGGRIKGEGCHFIDLIRFLVGEPITDWKTNVLGNNNLKDTVSMSFSFKDGSIATIHYFANGSIKVSKERIEVFCGSSILQLDNFRSLKGIDWPDFRSTKLSKQDKGHNNEIQSFLNSIKNNLNPPIPLDELMEVSRKTIEIADAL